ncbi:MAG: hypothetical protein ACRC4M_04170 [Mycoplasma sp.]
MKKIFNSNKEDCVISTNIKDEEIFTKKILNIPFFYNLKKQTGNFNNPTIHNFSNIKASNYFSKSIYQQSPENINYNLNQMNYWTLQTVIKSIFLPERTLTSSEKQHSISGYIIKTPTNYHNHYESSDKFEENILLKPQNTEQNHTHTPQKNIEDYQRKSFWRQLKKAFFSDVLENKSGALDKEQAYIASNELKKNVKSLRTSKISLSKKEYDFEVKKAVDFFMEEIKLGNTSLQPNIPLNDDQKRVIHNELPKNISEYISDNPTLSAEKIRIFNNPSTIIEKREDELQQKEKVNSKNKYAQSF